MLELPSPRKRPEPPEQIGTSQPHSKKQQLNHPSRSQPPSVFWNSLSKSWLTKRALREQDRRNRQAAPSPSRSPHRRARPPVTRKFIAEQKTNREAAHCTGYLSRCTPRILKNISLFARHGGPDLSDLRNYPYPTHCIGHTTSSSRTPRSRKPRSQQRDSATTSNTTRSSGVYDRSFQQHLVDNGIYPDAYEYPDESVPAKPSNTEDLKRMLAQPRPSLSPTRFTDRDFEKFKRVNAHAAKEKQVFELVIPIIEGETNPESRSGGIPFTNLDPLTDVMLKPGNPDVYYGARPEQLNRHVRNELSGLITPSTQQDLPMAPNLFLAAKGPDGSLAVAERQACYDGALGARGVHALQSYGQKEPTYDNNAYVITLIYHGGLLKMYTTHVAPPPNAGDRPEYHMHELRGWYITGESDSFRQGASAYRNARDWTQQQRNEAIMRANEKSNEVETEAPTGDATSSPTLSFMTVVSESEACTVSQSRTSFDEDGQEESDVSDDFVDQILPAKRPNTNSQHVQTRKRRDAKKNEQSKTVVDGKR